MTLNNTDINKLLNTINTEMNQIATEVKNATTDIDKRLGLMAQNINAANTIITTSIIALQSNFPTGQAAYVGKVLYNNGELMTLPAGYTFFLGQSIVYGLNIAASVANGVDCARYAGYAAIPTQTNGETQLSKPANIPSSWYLKTSGGANITRAADGGEILLDITNTNLQSTAVTYLTNVCKTEGWNCIFLDEINLRYSDGGWTGTPAKFPTDSAWQQAELAYVKALTKGLNANNIGVVANQAHSTANNTWSQQIATAVDMSVQEDWLNWSNLSGVAAAAQWKEYTDWMKYIESTTTTPIYMMYNTNTDIANFGLATVLLYTKGKSIFTCGDGPYTIADVNIPFAAKLASLGVPVSDVTLQGATYTRQFTGGSVKVTPPTTGQAATGLAVISLK